MCQGTSQTLQQKHDGALFTMTLLLLVVYADLVRYNTPAITSRPEVL